MEYSSGNVVLCGAFKRRKPLYFKQATVKISDSFWSPLIRFKTLTKHRHGALMFLFGLDFSSFKRVDSFRADVVHSSLYQAKTVLSRLRFENKKWEEGGGMQKHLNSLFFIR